MNKQILRWVVFGGLFLVPFIPFLVSSSFFFPYITFKAFSWRIIIEFIFAAWLLLALVDESYRPRKSSILYSLGLFLAVIGLADIFGESFFRSFWSNYERMEGYITLLHLGAFFLVISSSFKEIDWARWWKTSLAASFIMVLISSKEVLSSAEWRVDGTFGNPSYLAVYILFHIFLALFFMWRERKDKTLRWVYGLLIASQVFILYHTATRGAILGLLGGILIFAILNIRNRENRYLRKIGITTASILLLLVAGFWFIKDTSFVQSSPVLERFANINTEELRGGGRSFIWPMAVRGIMDKPILGWGQENFSYVFSKYYDPDMYRLEPWFDRAHNIFLDWGIAAGIPGLLSYLSLYLVLLYVIWRKDGDLAYVEKSLLTGLVAAYFIHNFFVFDHLVSYILFFSLLAYVHSRAEGSLLWNREVSSDVLMVSALPGLVILLSLSLYFFNIKPIIANTSLIDALNYMQVDGQEGLAVGSLENAYKKSSLGRSEVVEHITTQGLDILESGIPVKEKNAFFEFARQSVSEQANRFPREARLQIISGTFLASTGKFDEAKVYFDRAKEVMPSKQIIYFQSGSSYIFQKNYAKALEEFKFAYGLAPDYLEAKVVYLVGAIYARDSKLEAQLISELNERQYVFEDRILSAYYDSGRIEDTVRILKKRAELDPSRAPEYQKYIDQLQRL